MQIQLYDVHLIVDVFELRLLYAQQLIIVFIVQFTINSCIEQFYTWIIIIIMKKILPSATEAKENIDRRSEIER